MSPEPSERSLAGVINKHPRAVFLLVSAIYFIFAIALAQTRMFWEDEFFTLYEVRQPGFAALLTYLRSSFEGQTPLFMGLTQWLTRHFGESPLALRAPGIFFYWVALASVYWIVVRRGETLWAACAAFFLMATRTTPYAAEARSYGFTLGASALVLWCWLRVRERRSPFACVLLAASVMLAVSSHYYAVLILIPFGAAQLAEDVIRRRVTWPVWIAFSSAAIPLAFSIPFIQGARQYSTYFWSPPRGSQLLGTASVLIGPELGGLLAFGLVALIYLARKKPFYLALPESIALWGFVALPLPGWLLAVLVTHGYVERYVLQPIIAIPILLALGLASGFGTASRAALICAMSMCCVCLLFGSWRISDERGQRAIIAEIPDLIRRTGPASMPVAVTTVDHWLRLDREYSGAFLYLCDPDMSLKYLGHNATERNMRDHREIFPASLRMFNEFISRREPFLVFEVQHSGWLTRELLAEHWNLRMLGQVPDGFLYLAQPGP